MRQSVPLINHTNSYIIFGITYPYHSHQHTQLVIALGLRWFFEWDYVENPISRSDSVHYDMSWVEIELESGCCGCGHEEMMEANRISSKWLDFLARWRTYWISTRAYNFQIHNSNWSEMNSEEMKKSEKIINKWVNFHSFWLWRERLRWF